MALSLAMASEITKRMLWPTPALDSRLLDESDDEDDGGGGGGETPPGANPNSEFIIAPFVRDDQGDRASIALDDNFCGTGCRARPIGIAKPILGRMALNSRGGSTLRCWR